MDKIFKEMMGGGNYKSPDSIVIKYLNEIISGLKSIMNVLNRLLSNQSVINNKLNYLAENNKSAYPCRPIRFLTPRQLYMMVKDGYTLDEISLISGYDLKLVNEKIDSYIKNNT